MTLVRQLPRQILRRARSQSTKCMVSPWPTIDTAIFPSRRPGRQPHWPPPCNRLTPPIIRMPHPETVNVMIRFNDTATEVEYGKYSNYCKEKIQTPEPTSKPTPSYRRPTDPTSFHPFLACLAATVRFLPEIWWKIMLDSRLVCYQY